jgi:hypothetical protein
LRFVGVLNKIQEVELWKSNFPYFYLLY